ncbi:hypothetical protein BST13_29580 [Mycobacterium aquaticum]|uniref:Uncharacterized protein n=1 Tax=Mycobacterium aquaticum TaxID=1927124 RepID=A0A1X0ACU4_9MYCO|nr:hypothetical protein BST13_29580 [Mycobacterium aquaticum]
MYETTAVGFEPSAVIDEAAAIVQAEWMRLMADERSDRAAASYMELPAARTVPTHLGVLTAQHRNGLSDNAFSWGHAESTRRRANNVWATQRSPPASDGASFVNVTRGRRGQSLCDVAGPFVVSAGHRYRHRVARPPKLSWPGGCRGETTSLPRRSAQ